MHFWKRTNHNIIQTALWSPETDVRLINIYLTTYIVRIYNTRIIFGCKILNQTVRHNGKIIVGIEILNYIPQQNIRLEKVSYVILLVMLTIPYLSKNFIQMLITLTKRIKIPLKNFFFQGNNFLYLSPKNIKERFIMFHYIKVRALSSLVCFVLMSSYNRWDILLPHQMHLRHILMFIH